MRIRTPLQLSDQLLSLLLLQLLALHTAEAPSAAAAAAVRAPVHTNDWLRRSNDSERQLNLARRGQTWLTAGLLLLPTYSYPTDCGHITPQCDVSAGNIRWSVCPLRRGERTFTGVSRRRTRSTGAVCFIASP